MGIFREWGEYFRFNGLSSVDRSIVFYAEDTSSWRYYELIINELIGSLDKQICYVTSSPDDPVLRNEDQRIRPFFIGSGSARTAWFRFLQAGVLVMTMPDLGKYNIKRSKHPVHYVWFDHSIASTHMSGRLGAIDNYDAILCVGPHHKEEIRAAESLYGLDPKILIETGYGVLDIILNSDQAETYAGPPPSGGGKRVLVAPSWGPDALLENHGLELVEVLLQAGHQVTVRPHMMTSRRNPKLMAELKERFGSNPDFQLSLDPMLQGTVHGYDVMVGDWSGAAFEFAFGLERPVLFIDVPRKVMNPEYEKLGVEPIEVKLRTEIGAVVSPDHLEDVPKQLALLCDDPGAWRERLQALREQWIYNVGRSGIVGAAYIAEAADGAKTPGRPI